MSLYIVDIHGELEGDYEIVKKYEEPTTKNDLGVDLISRADVFQILWNYDYTNPSALIVKAIRELPSMTPQEPKTGHWKPYLKEGLRYQCSACDSRFDTPWEYCPHCGAKMAESEG